MYILLAIITICVFCIIIVRIVMKHKNKDLIIKFGNILISIKEHDKNS